MSSGFKALSPLEKAQAKMRELRDKGIEIKRLTPLEKAERNPKSRRCAINAKCYDCVGGDGADPGWMNEIGKCECYDCPLHSFRPYQGRAISDLSTNFVDKTCML